MFDAAIVKGDLAEVWTQYLGLVLKGATGHDDGEELREVFGVRLIFEPDADLGQLHPAMDATRHDRYLRKLLTSELDEGLGGSYGRRLRDLYEDTQGAQIDQVSAMVERLVERQESKSACANLLHPRNSRVEEKAGMRRTACLTSLQALIRNGQLHLAANFRSQDAVGSHGNFGALRALQDEIIAELTAKGLSIQRGTLYVHVVAAHVYRRDYEFARRVVGFGDWESA